MAATAACGGGSITEPPPDPNNLPTPTVACAAQLPLQLAVGQFAVVDPAGTTGCLRLRPGNPGGASYLVVVASTSGQRSSSGIQGGFLIRASSPLAATGVPTPAAGADEGGAPAASRPSVAAAFDATLRERERELAADPANRPAPRATPSVAAAPPTVGEHRDFKTCTNLACTAFATVAATLKYVGPHAAIYLDDAVPTSDPLQPADFEELGLAFDNSVSGHYGIDTTAFGRESDLDNNSVVDILMTDAVNALTPDCGNGRIIGYFFGGDLLTGPNSNRGEVFYTLVPAPATATCTVVTRRLALNSLKPTLIHEFQHMISYNQHVLVRGGSAEETWLNEGMSHFAEELGGRLTPNAECTIYSFSSCRSQYSGGNILDAYDFMKNPEAFFLVFPGSSNGSLEERGASWLFLRWALDQFAVDTILGTNITRALTQTPRVGADNLAAVTGVSFSTLVPEWLLALYLDDGTDLPFESTGRLRYKSWGLRAILTDPRNAGNFPLGFPLVAAPMADGFRYTGTLRGGSGKHFLVTLPDAAASLDIQVLKSNGAALDPALVTRFGIVRIR